MRGFTDEITPHQQLFECLGVNMRVCASSEDVLERIEQLLPLDRRNSEAILASHRVGIVTEDDGTFSVYNSGTRVSEGAGLELALVVLETQVSSYISLHAARLVFARAGVVGYEGRAIVIPGDSFSGKTTLVAALVRAGASYYSDQFAVFDDHGRVRPYRNAILNPEVIVNEVDDEQRNPSSANEPLPVGLVVSTYFRPGAEWRPTRLTGAIAALELLSDTVTVTTRPDEALKTVTLALAGAAVLKGARGEADELAPWLLEQVVAPTAD